MDKYINELRESYLTAEEIANMKDNEIIIVNQTARNSKITL